VTDELVMSMFTIYERPLDFPDCYVVREFHILRGNPEPVPTNHLSFAGTLAGARKLVPPSAGICMARSAGDEAQIVETWL
jgi:hypothetical protein